MKVRNKLYSKAFLCYKTLLNSLRIILNSKKSPYIAEYIGFVLYESGPYFGSIVLKYYPLGDLADYCRNLNKSSCCARQNRNKPKEINQLVDFAKQITEGD
jgi:hypothetical protein